MKARGASPNWGGARGGAGRKKQVRQYSDAIKSRLMRALEEQAKKTGKDWLEDLAEMNQDPKIQDSVRLAAKKLVADILVVKESVKTVETLPGVVELPSRVEDPVEEDKVSIQ